MASAYLLHCRKLGFTLASKLGSCHGFSTTLVLTLYEYYEYICNTVTPGQRVSILVSHGPTSEIGAPLSASFRQRRCGRGRLATVVTGLKVAQCSGIGGEKSSIGAA